MKNYNRHNDLISNFFFLIKKVYSSDISVVKNCLNKTRDMAMIISFEEDNDLNILRKGQNYSDFVLKSSPKELLELREIIKLLRLKLYENNLFDNYSSLLISRYLFTSWRSLIKIELFKKVNKRVDLKNLKNQTIVALKEAEFRSGLDCTFKTTLLLTFLSLPFKEWIEESSNLIDDDVDWIKNLTIKDIQNQKIILSPKLKKVKLISLIIGIEKGKKNYNESIGLEIKKFINFITEKNTISSDFNLSFLKSKDKNKEFAKTFLLLQVHGLITNGKTELSGILADSLNIKKRTLTKYKIEDLKDELDKNESDLANFIIDLV